MAKERRWKAEGCGKDRQEIDKERRDRVKTEKGEGDKEREG
jgi:hypothetical protein